MDKIKEKTKADQGLTEKTEEMKETAPQEEKTAPKARKPRARKPKAENTETEKTAEEKE